MPRTWPELLFGATLVIWNVRQHQKNRSVGKVTADGDVLDGVERDRSHRIEEFLFLVGIQFSRREPATGCQPTKGIRQPIGH